MPTYHEMLQKITKNMEMKLQKNPAPSECILTHC